MGYRDLAAAALLKKARELAKRYRECVAELVAVLGEIERRDLYLPKYASSFEYCIRELGLSEDDASKLLRTARAARVRPEVLSHLADGSLTPRAVSIIAPDSKSPDFPELLSRAVGKPLQVVKKMMAERHPEEAAKETTRAIGPEEYRMSFCANGGLKAQIDRTKDLLSNKHPARRLEDILPEVFAFFLTARDPLAKEPAERRKTLNPATREVPPSIRDEVWRRDEGRCAFERAGRRCEATRFLELDRIVPYALGGRSDDAANIRLLCRAHNQWEAKQAFG